MRLRRWSLLVIVAGTLVSAGCAVSRLEQSGRLVEQSRAFQAAPAVAAHRLLIIGDSTAFGTGASSPLTTVAGLIGRDHPDWTITNRGVNGATVAEFESQLPRDERYDTLLVMGGGNDVLSLAGMGSLRSSFTRVAERGRDIAGKVILMPPGNVGNSPAFYPPVSWWLAYRSRALHDVVQAVARSVGTAYVDLYEERAVDPFAQEPERMNAADGLHPSDAGYALWYAKLKRALP